MVMSEQQNETVQHRCPYPAAGCTAPNCHVTAGRFPERVVEALMRTEFNNAVTCTGPGEVGCRGRQGWHSWTDHRRHVAEAQLAELLRLNLINGMSTPPGATA